RFPLRLHLLCRPLLLRCRSLPSPRPRVPGLLPLFLRPHPFAAASAAFPRYHGSQIRGGKSTDREGESGRRVVAATAAAASSWSTSPPPTPALARIHDAHVSGAPFSRTCPPCSTTLAPRPNSTAAAAGHGIRRRHRPLQLDNRAFPCRPLPISLSMASGGHAWPSAPWIDPGFNDDSSSSLEWQHKACLLQDGKTL
ncbi:unnamed protein product, partial [Urochloa humidicola]